MFGAYSFLDKIATGIALFICSYGTLLDSGPAIRWMTVLVPSISCVIGWALVVFERPDKAEVE